MVLFSQRKGYKPIKKELQREEVDIDLKNRLWSMIINEVWDKWSEKNFYNGYDNKSQIINALLDSVWIKFIKQAPDTRPIFIYHQVIRQGKDAYNIIREFFYKAEWYEVYDFIEFIIKRIPNLWAVKLKEYSNKILEEENSAYRIVDLEIVEITDKTEIAAIEEAVNIGIKPVCDHIGRALQLIAEKPIPDYRNSIKESISAVEGCCNYVTKSKKGGIKEALEMISAAANIHPALKKSFILLYGYTSDSSGIRHALIDGEELPSFADAKFMLVACSSFINYIITKMAENNISIQE